MQEIHTLVVVWYDRTMISSITGRFFHAKSADRPFWITCIASLIMSGGIGLVIGLQQSVWFDEAYSILLAKHSVVDLIHLTSLDTHPPLYYLLLKAWAGLFGWNELALRALSVLAMMGALVVGGLLLRKMFGSKVAAGAVVVLALSPLLLRYGYEIRMYSLASLIGVSATYCLYSAYTQKAKRRMWLIGYSLLVVIGVYTLYYLALLWVAHVVWLICMRVRHKWHVTALLPYIYAYVGAIILFLPWMTTFISQLSNGALAPIGQPMDFTQLSGVLSFNLLYQPVYGLTVPLTILFLVCMAALVWSASRGMDMLRKHGDEMLLLGTYIGIPVVILMIVSLVKPMYTERYLSHVAIGLMMLVGIVAAIALQQRRRYQRYLVMVIIYGTLCVGVINGMNAGNFNFQRNEHPTVKQTAEHIIDCAAGSQLVAADPYVVTELTYYLPDCHIYFVSQWPTLRGGYAPWSGSVYQIQHASDITSPRVTYVYYNTPDQSLPTSYHVGSSHTYGSLHVTEYLR